MGAAGRTDFGFGFGFDIRFGPEDRWRGGQVARILALVLIFDLGLKIAGLKLAREGVQAARILASLILALVLRFDLGLKITGLKLTRGCSRTDFGFGFDIRFGPEGHGPEGRVGGGEGRTNYGFGFDIRSIWEL